LGEMWAEDLDVLPGNMVTSNPFLARPC